jgi:hypothetical protein
MTYLEQLACKKANRPVLVPQAVEKNQFGSVARAEFDRQARLPFRAARVVRLIPRAHSAFVGKRLTNLFRHRRALFTLALRMAEEDIVFVGDLVRFDPHDVFEHVGKNNDLMREITETLEAVGVPFGAAIPWWRRPERY